MMGGMVTQLEEIVGSATTFLEAGDAQGAITILTTVCDEVADAYEQFDDSDGELGGFLDELGQPLAEAILSADLDDAQREEILDKLERIDAELSDYGIDGLAAALAALDQGWKQGLGGEKWERMKMNGMIWMT